MRLSPHLTFDGECRAAFARYQEVLGGKIQTLLTYGESPIATDFDARWRDRILHATLSFGDQEIMGSDQGPGTYRAPHGVTVVVTVPAVDEGRRIFEGLCAGGSVILAFQPSFWTSGFGVLQDAFGIGWEVNCSDR